MEEQERTLRWVVARRLVDLLDDALPVEAESLAAIGQELPDQGFRLIRLALDLLTPERADIGAILGQPGQDLLGERALAEPAQALEDEYFGTLAKTAANAVLLDPAPDEPRAQHAAVAEAFEGALQDRGVPALSRRGRY